jgi:hypothetical protein
VEISGIGAPQSSNKYQSILKYDNHMKIVMFHCRHRATRRKYNIFECDVARMERSAIGITMALRTSAAPGMRDTVSFKRNSGAANPPVPQPRMFHV